MRFASLPMYDLPEVRAATDGLWAEVGARLRAAGIEDVPDALVRDGADDLLNEHWRHPDLLLSQSCAWPVAALLDGEVTVLGTFVYRGVTDSRGYYASHLVVRTGDTDRPLAGRRVAVNDTDSQSGWVSLRAAVAPLGPVLITGAHVESLAALRSGRADLAAIDAVTWALLARYRPGALAGLSTVGSGPVVPGLPLITRPTEDVGALREALAGVRSDPLLIDGFVPLDNADYAPVLDLA